MVTRQLLIRRSLTEVGKPVKPVMNYNSFITSSFKVVNSNTLSCFMIMKLSQAGPIGLSSIDTCSTMKIDVAGYVEFESGSIL